ncbi:SIN3-HDAC complex-associated factor-like isoform X2 [Oncorhynchus keta]|uniref:SIN3-HDAC complex-associated factor-like isoform X2 n=1 Tax=Oncorhynchus keta TaxID=8018 RepID=UPI00227C0243|nr:SIN3-HDAC complex-associated factor-like isoform X2 [Oncorhynchus keta]
MFGFHKPKMYRSLDGCCICRAKSSSSRFTDSKRYERDFPSCFGLSEVRFGEICNACVLLVKRWQKLPAGSIKNWNHVVDAKGSGSSWKTVRSKKMNRARPRQSSRVQKELKRHNSDAHSTTSSASPAHSPSYSNQSDEGSDVELSPGATHSPVFSFLDLTYWKRLNSLGFSNGCLAWFTYYFSDRVQCVKLEGLLSGPLPVSMGVPQGSILGPTLLCIHK